MRMYELIAQRIVCALKLRFRDHSSGKLGRARRRYSDRAFEYIAQKLYLSPKIEIEALRRERSVHFRCEVGIVSSHLATFHHVKMPALELP